VFIEQLSMGMFDFHQHKASVGITSEEPQGRVK
jgi:hypothetical protein